MLQGRIMIIPFLSGVLTPGGEVLEPDIDSILESRFENFRRLVVSRTTQSASGERTIHFIEQFMQQRFVAIAFARRGDKIDVFHHNHAGANMRAS